MALTKYHVSSSTEGWFVMTDSAISRGPFRTQQEAQRIMDESEDGDMLTQLLGYLQSNADELEQIKTRVLLPLATADRHNLQAQFDFDQVDRFVCWAREMVAEQQARWERRIHGR